MIAHRRGRVIVIDEAARRPIRLAPRPKSAAAGDGGTTIAPSAAPGGGIGV